MGASEFATHPHKTRGLQAELLCWMERTHAHGAASRDITFQMMAKVAWIATTCPCASAIAYWCPTICAHPKVALQAVYAKCVLLLKEDAPYAGIPKRADANMRALGIIFQLPTDAVSAPSTIIMLAVRLALFVMWQDVA
jgi:hypothetical protein